MNDFLNVILEGFRLVKNLASIPNAKVKEIVAAYIRVVVKWSVRLFIAAAVPLIVVVPCLISDLPFGGLYGAYAIWVVLLISLEMLILTPSFLVLRHLRKLFPEISEGFSDWFGIIKSFVFNGFSLAIFVWLFPIWRAPGSFPILLIVLACWAILPVCSVSRFCKRIYPSICAVQLLFLLVLLVFQIVFPQHVKQMGWVSGRKVGSLLVSAVQQKEITADWKTFEWFSNQGEPLVWYSGSKIDGYKLWAAPGFDSSTGKELTPVSNHQLKEDIVAHLHSLDVKRQLKEAQDDARAQRLAEEMKKKTEASRLLELETLAESNRIYRAEADARARKAAEAERREYIARNMRQMASLKEAGKTALAIAVSDSDGNLDEPISTLVAGLFTTKGVNATGGLFTPAFAREGAFLKVNNLDQSEINRLGVTNLVDMLFLCSYNFQLHTNSELEGIITARMKFQGNLLSTVQSELLEDVSIEVSGVGFQNDIAISSAKERLNKALSLHKWKFIEGLSGN